MTHEHTLRSSDVVRRAVSGAASLGGGQVAAQVLNIGGAIMLARMLAPADFGLFAILTFFLRPAAVAWACALPAGAAAWWWRVSFPITTLPELLLCGAAAFVVYAVALGIGSLALFRPARAALAPYLLRAPSAAFRMLGRDM